MMEAANKALELMSKINGQLITKKVWLKASDYAKADLKRKAMIVVDEILNLDDFSIEGREYWNEVKTELINF
jgi:hypothetical protein